jgi:hypothetical protein
MFDAARHDAYLCSGKCRAKAFRMKHRKGYHTKEPQLGHDLADDENQDDQSAI